MLEIDLFEPVRCMFEGYGYTVNAEVNGCDVVATKEDETVIIELKKDFNLKLVHQIVNRQTYADVVYAAIARPKCSYSSKRWTEIIALIKRLEAGLIVVHEANGVFFAEVAVEPAPYVRRKNTKKHRLIALEVDGRTANYNKGGSTRIKLMTAYKENALFVACCIAKIGDMKPKEIVKFGTGAKTASILQKNFHGWFKRLDDGCYTLTDGGWSALIQYKTLADSYYEKIVIN